VLVSAAPLSPGDLSTALAVYVEAGSYAAAARAVGRDESTVRKALRRHAAPERAELFAVELADAHANALRATRKARRKAVAALDVSTDPRDIALMAHTIHENLRAITTARAAHGRLVAAEQAVEARVREELEGALERLRHALPREAFDRALHALSDDTPEATTTTTMHGVVVQYDGERPVSTMSTEELHARVERLVESIHGEALALVDTLPDGELEARLRAGFVSLVERARAGDTEARRALAPLVEASQVPVGVPVVYLPREEPP